MLARAKEVVATTASVDPSSDFFHDVIHGLQAEPKALPPKYFYDTQGSRLFDEVCRLDEYYPYRTELDLLPRVAQELAHKFQPGSGLNVVEFGAGSLCKIRPLLQRMTAISRFTAIDISGDHLQRACNDLASEFPALSIHGIEGDFTKPLQLGAHKGTFIGFFPGSTIGNLSPGDAIKFLANARKTLGPNSYLLLGVDTKKDELLLRRAYNDCQGVTARFNKNMLARINRELDANFNLDDFQHYAWYNRAQGRVEMHLRSQRRHQVRVRGYNIAFERGETIHTENSYKYHPHEFEVLARRAGWRRCNGWLAEGALFSITLLCCDD